MVFITDVNFLIYFKYYYYIVKRHEPLDMALYKCFSLLLLLLL